MACCRVRSRMQHARCESLSCLAASSCPHLAGARHLSQVPQQAKSGDICAGGCAVRAQHRHGGACRVVWWQQETRVTKVSFLEPSSTQFTMHQPSTLRATAPHRCSASCTRPPPRSTAPCSRHASQPQTACLAGGRGVIGQVESGGPSRRPGGGTTHCVARHPAGSTTAHPAARSNQADRRERQQLRAPVPRGLVSTSACPGRAPPLDSSASRGALPCTEKPAGQHGAEHMAVLLL